ncbi:MAG TPA: tRNA (adenosine(37)-N6)-threonylcarbamoyltransferase complex transferase subunit TsaD [Candidatus Magasanikbacteria bacterium]|nr:tRNA (adenosine(37)-N6)-threonylcarbamoyltransferase complex transferase subunit TsaD [Candidatus Magasanikbacteria bacterium]
MKILGIESSCDDTSVALIEMDEKNLIVLAEKTASQIDIHAKFGGVIPEVAGRLHAEYITPVIEEVLKGQERPDAIAVTFGPGLITGLLVGIEAAKTLSYVWNIPLIPVNHIEGHFYSPEISKTETKRRAIEYPALALIVSGGHTELALSKKQEEYEKIGGTRDDAVGECFDKVAKLLGIPYPGGPKISKLAEKGKINISFPRPMQDSDNLDMSFSGLKTAVLYWLKDHPITIDNPKFKNEEGEFTIEDVCASVEAAITDVLISKTTTAINAHKPKTLILAGGVSANKKLRGELQMLSQKLDISFRLPELSYTTDNAAMIAVAGFHRYNAKKIIGWKDIAADPQSTLYTY